MSKRPWFPWYPSDYLNDTSHLTPQEDLLYRRLLELHWKDRSLPQDPYRLSRLSRLPKDWFEVAWPEVSRYFREQEGRLVNPRMVAEIRKADDLSETRRDAAYVRWQEKNSNGIKPPYANALQVECHPQPHPDPPPDPDIGDEDISSPLGPETEGDEPPFDLSGEEEENGTKSPERRSLKAPASQCPAEAIMALYNATLVPPLREAVSLSRARRGHIKALWGNGMGDMETWQSYFAYVGDSRFLTGQVDAGRGRSGPFRADLDWLIKPSNELKIREGKYHGE